MNIIRLAVELFVIYLLYKIIFEFIVPVYRTTRHMKQKMTEMHTKMQQEQESYERMNSQEKPSKPDTSKAPMTGDYIEFEEVK